jgi:hypothetical protein
MAERKPAETGITNWAVVMFGGMLLALAILVVPDPFLRVLAVLVIYVAVIYVSQAKEEPELDNPLLEQLRPQSTGLDRRKYGRLRSSTDRMLDQVRDMNRVAVEGREGKIAPRHAHAELDRLAAGLRDMIDEIRKSAGVPTPTEETTPSGSQQIVMPKTHGDSGPAAVDDTDRMLDALEAQAIAKKDDADKPKQRGEDPRGP